MKKYIGTKSIEAEVMTKGDAEKVLKHPISCDSNDSTDGYLVKYEGGYLSWSPKDVFEKAYHQFDSSEEASVFTYLTSCGYDVRYLKEEGHNAMKIPYSDDIKQNNELKVVSRILDDKLMEFFFMNDIRTIFIRKS